MQITVRNKRVLAFFGFYGPEDEPIDTWVSYSHRIWWKLLRGTIRKRFARASEQSEREDGK